MFFTDTIVEQSHETQKRCIRHEYTSNTMPPSGYSSIRLPSVCCLIILTLIFVFFS
uniref:Ribosome biogenesis protein RLP24 n=1 Tax=Arundo donax TaxID=35708 RepID=A0A0A9ASM6_ARUDO